MLYLPLLQTSVSVLECAGDIYVVSAYIPIELGYRNWRCLHGTLTLSLTLDELQGA